jgi:tetratricopeptide (TPR) repeat protein
MKKNTASTAVFTYLFLIPFLFLACAGKMSVEEAKNVTVQLSKESFVPPPRRIDDILSVLDQSGQDDLNKSKKLREKITTPPPQTDDPASLSVYYQSRGDALMQMGRHSQALTDLRLALTYSSHSHDSDYRLLRELAYAEYACGNFKRAIEHMERALVKDSTSVYTGLVKLYTRIGDLDAAQRMAKKGVELCNRKRSQSGGRTWPAIHAAFMKAMVLEAQGKFAEAEPHYRQMLQYWSRPMQKKEPFYYAVHKIYLTQNLKNQDRLVEAEVEARDAQKNGCSRQGIGNFRKRGR